MTAVIAAVMRHTAGVGPRHSRAAHGRHSAVIPRASPVSARFPARSPVQATTP